MDDSQLTVIADNEKEWRYHILKKLEWFEKEQIKHGKDIARLGVKSSIWGAVGGAIIVAIWYFKKGI